MLPPASLSGIPVSATTDTLTSAPPFSSWLNPLLPLPVTSHSTPSVQPPEAARDLSLSMSTRPMPARLVQQIHAGRYVNMRDILGDNVMVRRHFEEVHRALGFQVLPVTSRPRVQEVTSLPSWVCCYLSYLAVATPDLVTRERLTYAILLLREAMRTGGNGWLKYDRLFRQRAAIEPTIPWIEIHPCLQATTILSQRHLGPATFCILCQECDHVAAQCAMGQFQQPCM